MIDDEQVGYFEGKGFRRFDTDNGIVLIEDRYVSSDEQEAVEFRLNNFFGLKNIYMTSL